MENTTETQTECKGDILLRRVPCAVLEAITKMKIELHQRNPLRSSITISEAVYKLILKEGRGTSDRGDYIIPEHQSV